MRCYKSVALVWLVLLLSREAHSQTLHNYWWLYDRTHISEFEQDKFSFDEDGIIKNNDEYHPSSISVFGLLSLEEYKNTGDSVHYHNYTNQISYFRDTSKTHSLFDGKGLGLPYNFSYHDLKPPWYSGLAQGYALSFLLRYHEHSGDDDILRIVHRIAYLFLKDEQEGGVLSKTREGLLWIEEYPLCPKARQVFNGFLVGLFGLGDYCDYFPQKAAFKSIHTEVSASLKALLREYDAPTWALYSRSTGKHCTAAYMLAQIYQMKYLYELTEDSLFLNQTMLWSAHMGLRPVLDSSYCYVHPKYRFSMPLLVKYDSADVVYIKHTYEFPSGNYQSPDYAHYKSKHFEVKQGEPVKLEIPKTTGTEPTIFVRYGSFFGELSNAAYHADQLVENQTLVAPKDGLAEVILVYPLDNFTKIEGEFIVGK